MDTKKRTLTKALSYRVFGTLITIIVSGIITRSIHIALSVGIIDTVVKLLAYYLHDRLWSKITWGVLTTGVNSGTHSEI